MFSARVVTGKESRPIGTVSAMPCDTLPITTVLRGWALGAAEFTAVLIWQGVPGFWQRKPGAHRRYRRAASSPSGDTDCAGP